MNEKEIMEYSQECGQEASAGLLLLIGPDGFQGDYETYLKLEKILNGGNCNENDKPQRRGRLLQYRY